jgi:hypothetical protein
MFRLFQYSWHLNFTRIIVLFIAILPGVMFSIFSGQLSWLTSSFLAVCSILPYLISYKKRLFSLTNALIIFSLIYLVTISLGFGWIYLLILLSVLSLIAGFLENRDEGLRGYTTWVMIGTVYGGEKLAPYHLNLEQWIFMGILTLIGIGCAIFFYSKKILGKSFNSEVESTKNFIYNFRYLCPVVFSVLICHYFDVREPQWMLWSSLSVVYPNFESVILKMKHRFFGVSIGTSCGLLIGLLLPSSEIVTYICFVMIMLSFGMFEDYALCFLTRCFFVVLYAGNESTEIALIRLSNVVIGGIIGIVCMFFLSKIDQAIYSRD